MSERVLKVLLSELTKIRIHCKNPNCGMIFEVALADMPKCDFTNCPVCEKRLIPTPRRNESLYSIAELTKAMTFLCADPAKLQIEFVVPEITS